MGRGRKVKMGRRQILKIDRRRGKVDRRQRKIECRRRQTEKMRRVVKMGPKEIKERRDLQYATYTESLMKSEGFDMSRSVNLYFFGALREYRCDDGCYDLVLLYARMGLHRYNLLQGTKFQLSSVKKYNRRSCAAIYSYYITLEAQDPLIFGSLQTFQAKVDEQRYRKFDLKCTVARLLGETKKTITGGDIEIKSLDKDPNVLELPQENPFLEDGTNRFYLLKDSELQENEWIRLYLELAVATTNKKNDRDDHSLTSLKILKVAMESTQGLGDYNAVYYIRYEDSCQARVGNDVHRVAIVRRILDKHSEVLSLLGHNQSINPSLN